MSTHHSKDNEQMHSPLKTILGKIGNRYQTYYTAYKTHTMVTHHRDTGHPVARDDPHIEYPETTGMDNDNDSISGLDATVALGGLEAEDNTSEHLPNNQAQLMALMREISDLHQWVEVREGQPAENLDHIEWVLQNLSHASATASTNTYWTHWRSDTSVHRHLVPHTKADKPN